MKNVFITPGQLTKRLHSEPWQTLGWLDFSTLDSQKAETLRAQLLKLQSLIDEKNALLQTRKAVNASVGKAKRSGEDAQILIDESKQLSKKLTCSKDEIDALVTVLVPEVCQLSCSSGHCDASNATSNTTDEPKPVLQTRQNPTPDGPAQFKPLQPTSAITPGAFSVSHEADADCWNAYVNEHLHATHYHQYEWRDLIWRNFKQQTHYLAARDLSGNLVGIINAVHLKSLVVGSCMISAPFLAYGGPLVDHPAVDKKLVDALTTLSMENGCLSTQLRETRQRLGWCCSKKKVSLVMNLPPDTATLNDSFTSKLRSQIRRAARENPHFTMSGLENLDEFYSLFSIKMRDHGTPVYSRSFFEDILTTFPDSTYIATVRHGDRTVAASFLISFRDTLEIPWAASRRESDRFGMNMFMYHNLLEEAICRGFRYFDMGRSTRESSTWRFKRQWGAVERQQFWHTQPAQIDKPTTAKVENESASDMMLLAARVWRLLPVTVANRIGPALARQLPW